jgi:hypothetical protein
MATITKGKTFASGEVVTPQKMHDMVDLATVAGIVNADIDASAAIAAAKLASTLDLSGKTVTLPNTSVTAAMLASTLNLSSKTVTLPDDSVTAANLNGVADVNTKTANYTLVLADAGRVIEFNSASNLTLTIPTNASVAFGSGTMVTITRRGAGEVTVAGASGVTLRSSDSRTKISKQYAAAGLIKLDTNEWMLIGSLKV